MKKIYLFTSIVFYLFTGLAMNAQPCTGVPASNSIVAQYTLICTGDSARLSLANTYTDTGITYQWQESTISQVGPWTSIPGATLSTYKSGPLSMLRWFNVVITCTNSTQSISDAELVWAHCQLPCSGLNVPTTVSPAAPTICMNSAVSLTVAPLNPFSAHTFTWGYYSQVSQSYSFFPVQSGTLSSFTSGPLAKDTSFVLYMDCVAGGTFSMFTPVSVPKCCAGIPASNTVTGTQTICAGSVASLSLANTYTDTGITYQWQSSPSFVGPFSAIPGATLSTLADTLNATTFYQVVITCAKSSQSISLLHKVTAVTCTSPCTPNANFSLVPTNTLQLWNAIPALTSGIAAAQWQWGDGSTSNTLFTSHQYSAAGMYNICLSVTLTCGTSAMSCSSYSVYRSSSGIVYVNVVDPAAVDIEEAGQPPFVVFPNPNSGHFSVQFRNADQPASVEITNLAGQVVYQSAHHKGVRQMDINVSHLPNGVYFVKVGQGRRVTTSRISLNR